MSGLSLPELVRLLALDLLVMVLSLSVHECAHAWVALRLGDDTAEREGRLSLSPATHVDPLGTLLIPAMSIFLGGGSGSSAGRAPARSSHAAFAVRSRCAAEWRSWPPRARFRTSCWRCSRSVSLRSASAPTWAYGTPTGRTSGIAALLVTMFHVNVGLMVFNFLPIPPLDGSRLLPRSMDELQARIAPYSMVLLLLIINVPFLSRYMVLEPIRVVANVLQTIFQTQIFDGIA